VNDHRVVVEKLDADGGVVGMLSAEARTGMKDLAALLPNLVGAPASGETFCVRTSDDTARRQAEDRLRALGAAVVAPRGEGEKPTPQADEPEDGRE